MTKDTNKDLGVDWLISHFRWVWLVIAFILVFLNPPADENSSLVYILLGAGVGYNLLVIALLSFNWYPIWVAYTISVFDTILSIALMWFTGGHNSFMLPVLLFPVVSMVARFTPEVGLLLSALPMSLAYGASAIVYGNVETTGLVSDLAVLFSVGIIAGYISQKQVQLKATESKEVIRNLQVENDRAKVIYEMANTLGSTLDYHKVLTAMVELAQMALSEAKGSQDKAAVGMVLLFDQDGPLGNLRLVTGRNVSRHDEGKQIPLREGGALTEIVYRAEAVINNDLQSSLIIEELTTIKKCNSMISAPLRAGFDMYGLVLFASPKKDFYTEEHASLLTTFCNQAIIAMQNAELYADLERKQKKLLEKEAQARHELARNLHDGPTQAIAAIAMRLNFVQQLLSREGNIPKTLEEINKIEEIALRTTKEIRNMLFTLRPVVLETQGIVAAIEQYADRMREVNNLNIRLDIGGYDGQLSSDQEGVVFAIVEEAVGNAKKYSKADLIGIKLVSEDGYVIAQVADNGKGFDVNAVKSTYDQRGSLGLLNMEERAEMVGGRCYITSTVGKGTTVKIEVPIRGNGNR